MNNFIDGMYFNNGSNSNAPKRKQPNTQKSEVSQMCRKEKKIKIQISIQTEWTIE